MAAVWAAGPEPIIRSLVCVDMVGVGVVVGNEARFEDVVWNALATMRGCEEVTVLVGAGKASSRALLAVDSFVMKALAAKGMPRVGRREESSVRRAAEENVVTVGSVSSRLCRT